MSNSRLILLDRDGTLIVEKDYLNSPDGVDLIEGAASAVSSLREMGHRVVLITNQSGVARGYFTVETVEHIHRRIEELLSVHGAVLDGVYYCPHGPEDGCNCRKPNSGMLQQAAKDTGLPLETAVVVGDKPADIEAAKRVGATAVLVRTGYGLTTEQRKTSQPDAILDSIADLPGFLVNPLSS
ncbi:D-glycero-beta-D-manno-heptose 1,7-bisphosphate 7-phosphatase [bacterium]|nr:D-glycero-beta-D-manno-heptose 1,7-bisphosphate 7-phosphatase [bacterium]